MLKPLLEWIKNHKEKYTMTDSQFEDAFTSAGGWFFLTEYELIKNWQKEKDELIDLIYKTNSDSEKAGTVTRVNAIRRIIDNKMDKKALEKIRDSERIKNDHPDSSVLAELLLRKYH